MGIGGRMKVSAIINSIKIYDLYQARIRNHLKNYQICEAFDDELGMEKYKQKLLDEKEELGKFSTGKQYFGIIYAPIKCKKGEVFLELINQSLYFVRCDDFGERIHGSEILVEMNCDGVKLACDVCELLEEASGMYVKFSFIRE